MTTARNRKPKKKPAAKMPTPERWGDRTVYVGKHEVQAPQKIVLTKAPGDTRKPKPKKPEKPRVDEFWFVYRRVDSGDINRYGGGAPYLYPERYAIRDIDGKVNPSFERVRIVSAPVRGRRK